MQSDLTIDRLCNGLKEILLSIAKDNRVPVDQENGIQVWGTPADAGMKDIMEAFGGTIKITVREIPFDREVTPDGAALTSGASLWHPNDVVQRELDDECCSTEITPGEGSRARS